MDNYRIIKPEAAGSFAEAQESVLGQLEAYLADEAAAGRAPVLIKFFLSDAQNQIGRLSGAFLAEPSFGEDRNDSGDCRAYLPAAARESRRASNLTPLR